MKNTVATFVAAKGKEKLTMITAYDYTMAKIIDQSGVNSILVGDSLGMVTLGYPDTLSVTMEDMIHHCAAVSRGVENALLICDMPFMSSQCGAHDTLVNAGRLIKEGHAHAVKLEGGDFTAEIEALVRASIPVISHLGLTPQSVNAFGGFKVQGKTQRAAQKLLDDARAAQDAGAFCILLEGVPSALGAKITASLSVPTIGIGAGPDCDGQVLVWQDMLGLTQGHTPKFARQFANVGETMRAAFKEYNDAVKQGAFPANEHCYSIDQEIVDSLR